ncbi:MAG: thymidine phosphorylase [Candidatus Eisenbacteria bacterium]
MALDPREFLRAKRDGHAHDPEALRTFIAACASGEIPRYQASAWLMAAFLKGLDAAETDALTQAFLHSGRVFDWQRIGVAADKHSTGGVGDKISLILAPLVAACGVPVPMVSGRGLGHTGGTLDKLESIPGFRTRLEPAEMAAQLQRLNVFMVGQGPDLAPADGLFYSLRDVTSTVEFEPFIVSSIVSKKIAEGARALVYDVKVGNGAFMKTRESARSLATRLVRTTQAMGAAASACITDMSWPIGAAVGNALEVVESWEVLTGDKLAGTRPLTLALAAEMVRLAGAARTSEEALELVTRNLDDGSAADRFLTMVRAQGGDPSLLEERKPLHASPVTIDLGAPRDGYLAACDCFALGELVVAMGGGRLQADDAVDPRVGLLMLRGRGSRVKQGEAFARLHLASDEPGLMQRALACFTIADAAPATLPEDLVLERVTG